MEIQLTNGMIAYIDREDFNFVMLRINKWGGKEKRPWHFDGSYATANGPEGEKFYLHRKVLRLEKGDKRHVDHKNGNKLDCRKKNLILHFSSREHMQRHDSSRWLNTAEAHAKAWATRKARYGNGFKRR